MAEHAPFIQTRESSFKMQADVLLALLMPALLSFVFYGWRPILLLLCGIGSAVLFETLLCLWLRRPPSVTDGTACVTGALIGLMMSPISPYWLPVVASAFAIGIVKMPFGGTGRNLFNPAAAGIVFVTVLFPRQLLLFPAVSFNMQPLPLGDVSHIAYAASPSAQWLLGGQPNLEWDELLLSQFSGPIGTTAVLLLIACFIYLLARQTVTLSAPFSFLFTAFIGSALLWNDWKQAALAVLATPALFAGIFLITDPVTSPGHTAGRVLYGITAALLLLLLRAFARYEDSVCFAVLLANATAPILDRLGYTLSQWAHRLLKKGAI